MLKEQTQVLLDHGIGRIETALHESLNDQNPQQRDKTNISETPSFFKSRASTKPLIDGYQIG